MTGFAGQVSPSDDFIKDLGGTSLGVVQVVTELERQFGRRLRLNEALADTSVGRPGGPAARRSDGFAG